MEDLQYDMANFIANCDWNKIDKEQVEDSQYRVMDWLGCAVLGYHYPQSQIARRFVQQVGGVSQASIIGDQSRYPVALASWANGIIGHVSELDDGHRQAIGHPGSVTIPVAIAISEYIQATGSEFLKSILLGYDVFIRMGRVVNPSHYATWHTTGTCGAFAAVATAASLLKLNVNQTCNALGIVATLSSGLIESFGSYAKALTVGNACQNGVMAAFLAKDGFTGSQTAIIGSKGFIAATSSAKDFTQLTGLSEKALTSNTAFFKTYASCGHTNSPLDALFILLKKHPIDVENIERIEVNTYKIAVDITSKLTTKTEDEAKFSLPFCVAIALIYGSVSLALFDEKTRTDKKVLTLASKVKVLESESATVSFPKRKAEINIYTNDGIHYKEEVLDSSDEINFNVIENKFRQAVLNNNSKEVEKVISSIKNLPIEKDISGILNFINSLF